ncbi:Calcium-activated potassium channel subunit alpha-1 [Hypsibius exemplaris]|uniref:Calcium-activated potassium channel subunit alpha-1 n=1 Tax=Hypsibius exemplaris TaxID=2072580 RepID=A0A1W0WKY7_HYPEX|nr:Calcium-activated potassium channel subunit alpha-1 [Hypsibius exemplaris]
MPPKSRGKDASTSSAKTRVSPKRAPSPRKYTEAMEDHEIELESLFQLNLDAASGELPSQQLSENHLISVKTSSEAITSSLDASVNNVPDQPLKPPMVPELLRKPKRPPQKAPARSAPPRIDRVASFSAQDDDVVQKEAQAPPALRRVDRYDDQDAVDALVRGFQPFLSNDGSHADFAFPLALPVPVVGVAEHSALKGFRDQMTERQQECEVPLPESDDLHRFFMELRDGQGIHIQLPTLAFPVQPKDSRTDGQFVLVGHLGENPQTGKTEVVTSNNNRRLHIDISQQNVPSLMAEVFNFHHTKDEADTGTVTMQAVDMVASLAGSLNFKDSSFDPAALSIRRNNVLDKVESERRKILDLKAERKRKLEAPPAAPLAASLDPAAMGTTVSQHDAATAEPSFKRQKRKLPIKPAPAVVEHSTAPPKGTNLCYDFLTSPFVDVSLLTIKMLQLFRNYFRFTQQCTARYVSSKVIPTKSSSTFYFRDANTEGPSKNYILLVVPLATFCLGTWQLYRLQWKLGLIEERTTRMRVSPLSMEDLPDDLDKIREMEYRLVKLTGVYDHNREIYIAPRSPVTSAHGSGGGLVSNTSTHGAHVITPFKVSDSDTTILVDRGWVPKRLTNPQTRLQAQLPGEVTVTGVLRNSETRNAFSPDNVLDSKIFQVRDIEAMANFLKTAPVYLDATSENDIPGGPIGGQTIVHLRNEHFNYALTWFSSHYPSKSYHTTMDTGSVPIRDAAVTRMPYNPNVSVALPAPCYMVGEVELVYVYFGAGFVLPILALLYVQFSWFKRFLFRKLIQHNLMCGWSVPVGENSVMDEREAGLKRSGAERVRLIREAKARQSKCVVLLTQAASSQGLLGQILMAIAIVCSGTSFAIYLSTVTWPIKSVEFCGTLPNIYQPVDFTINAYLLLYFIIRLLGNEKKVDIVLRSMHSIVDYFTIPGVILSVILNRYFVGFAFFRAYNSLWIVEILANRGVFRNVNKIQLAHLVLLVVSVLIIASGFLHLVENMGDPWVLGSNRFYNGQLISFWRCFLYLYGRVTLLDLSGMRIHTMLGRIIIYGFQILALGIVSKAIPRIVALLRIVPECDKSYPSSVMSLHLVVCGHVRVSTMTAFLKEFYNSDRDLSDYFKIVILDDKEPDEEMDCLLELYFNKLDYRRGSCMNMKDLNRVKVMDAEAVLILADRTTSDSDAEDASNIMRVVSIKNYRFNARVIVQLLQYHNKVPTLTCRTFQLGVPSMGDVVICIAELRLGLLAQSCTAPASLPLMANYFTTGQTMAALKKHSEAWMAEYDRGTSFELYSRPFSAAFIGNDFTQACEFCYRRLKIVLLALHTHPDDPLSAPQISPPASVTIEVGTHGYFIADTTQEVDRAQFYCIKCHGDLSDPEDIQRCACPNIETKYEVEIQSFGKRSKLSRAISYRPDTDVETKIWSFISKYPRTPERRSSETDLPAYPHGRSSPFAPSGGRDNRSLYDSTGMFHWCPAKPLAAVQMDRLQATAAGFANHIVVCVLSQSNSQIIGLANLVLPLRASSLKADQLRDIVVLGDVGFLEKEWPFLHNMPRLYIVKGTALNRSDLRAVRLNTCQMCVILGAPSASDKMAATDPTLADKAVILATLNVRAMRFSPAENSVLDHENNRYSGVYEEHKIIEPRLTGYEVPLITDLMRESNVQFLEQDDEDLPGTEFYLTQPYAGGRTFAATVLDLLMITSFFNPPIVKVFHAMIFGGASLELERLLAEGAGLIGGEDISLPAETKDQISVIQMALDRGPLRSHVGSFYGGLFLDALINLGLVVLGVSRRVDLAREMTTSSSKRYVISNPPHSFILDVKDEIFALRGPNWKPSPNFLPTCSLSTF